VIAPRAWFLAVTLASVLAGCGGDETSPKPDAGGHTKTGCVPGEVTREDGTCQPAGVPPESCGEGFEPGDGGCTAILPADPCGPGQVALPGETGCHGLSECGSGSWGDIPVDGATEFVDASFTGTSDGSETAPWTTIQKAVNVAAPGAIVAVAAGSYVEDVRVGGSAVRIWGRCPTMVEIVGQDPDNAAIVVVQGAGGSEVRGLALRGAGRGMIVTGSQDVVVDGVWIHDTADHGLDVADAFGPTSVGITRSLIESSHTIGLYVSGARATVDETVVRAVHRVVGKLSASGIAVQNNGAARAHADIRRSVLERNDDIGLYLEASDVSVESTSIRDTQLGPDLSGGGVEAHPDAAGGRASLTLRSSVLERNGHWSVGLEGSDATIEATTIRDTVPGEALIGRGIEAEFLAGNAPVVVVKTSVIERSTGMGIGCDGCDVTVESTIIRDTALGEIDSLAGGVVATTLEGQPRARLAVRGSVVERNADMGIFSRASDVAIETTAVRDSSPTADQLYGRGIGIEWDPIEGASKGSVRAVSIERCREAGLAIVASEVTAEDVTVLGTLPRESDGQFGDGIVVVGGPGSPGSVQIAGARVEGSARTGISAFGASVGFGGVVLECNQIDLDGEGNLDIPADFQDHGGNVCGCKGKSVACQVKSTNLSAPPAQKE